MEHVAILLAGLYAGIRLTVYAIKLSALVTEAIIDQL